VPDNAGLVTIYNDGGTPYLQFWRTVFKRRAPENLPHVEHTSPIKVGQGNTTREIGDELLEALERPIEKRPRERSVDSLK